MSNLHRFGLEFQSLVERIARTPPTRGFGFKHFKAGQDRRYCGPTYGKSTMADAYYWAGVTVRKNKEMDEPREPTYVFRLDLYRPESHDSALPERRDLVHTGYYFTMTGAKIGASLRCRRLGGYNYRIERENGTPETIALAARP